MEAVGRVFAAVPLSPDARLAMAHQISGLDIPGRLVPPDNWHLTLRFLGTIDEATYERFIHGLATSGLPDAFMVSFDGIGGFPNDRRAAVVWAGVDVGAEELIRLSELTEDAARDAGLAPEDRPYRPHLTLSRVRPPQGIRHLQNKGVRMGFLADRLVVYRSHTGRGGARYEPLEEFGLNR